MKRERLQKLFSEDKEIFHGVSYMDLQRKRRDRK